MIAAVVPVKSLLESKSRLRQRFSNAAVERLAAAMLEDVLGALREVEGLDRVLVVTPDPDVAAVAKRSGAEVLLRDDPGLNPAIDAAARHACGEGDGLLVVLGDVAGIRAGEISRLLAAIDPPGVVLAPARDGGSSALLRVPHDAIPAGFGVASAERHRSLARAAGVAIRELSLPSLAIDVDEPADLEALLASDVPAPHTRAAWRELGATRKACRS